jgi:hypothetical protein
MEPRSDHDQGPWSILSQLCFHSTEAYMLVRDTSLDVVAPWELPGPTEVFKELGDVLTDVNGTNV